MSIDELTVKAPFNNSVAKSVSLWSVGKLLLLLL